MRELDLENAYIFKNEMNDLIIQAKKELPENLYKYYSLNSNSSESLKDNYLFFSHPHQLNDVMDSNFFLWDMKSFIIELSKKRYDIISNYTTGKKFEDQEREKFIKCYTKYYGILSLTENPFNNLMWPHYTQEEGFCVEFKSSKLIKHFKDIETKDLKNYIIPISYQFILKAREFKCLIDEMPSPLGKKNFDARFAIMYPMSVKDKDWAYEDEWRIIMHNKKFDYVSHPLKPISQQQQKAENRNNCNRKINIESELIEKVILGQYFFNHYRFKDFNGEIGNAEIYYFDFEKQSETIILRNFLIEMKNNYSSKVFQVGHEINPKNNDCNRTLIYQIEIIKITEGFIEIIRSSLKSELMNVE